LLPFKEPYLTLIGDASKYLSMSSLGGTRPNSGGRGVKTGKGYGCAGAFPVEPIGEYGPVKPMTYLSYTSPLINLVMSGKHNGVKLQGEDLLRLIAWVDCNCVYRGEEEVRQIPDPPANKQLPVPYKTRTAPIIDRTQTINDPAPATNHTDPKP
jgi:hypothetical protein